MCCDGQQEEENIQAMPQRKKNIATKTVSNFTLGLSRGVGRQQASQNLIPSLCRSLLLLCFLAFFRYVIFSVNILFERFQRFLMWVKNYGQRTHHSMSLMLFTNILFTILLINLVYTPEICVPLYTPLKVVEGGTPRHRAKTLINSTFSLKRASNMPGGRNITKGKCYQLGRLSFSLPLPFSKVSYGRV